MNSQTSSATETARTYYNSQDADLFYAEVWGGEHIHIGLYDSPDDSISSASKRTVERLAALAGPPTRNSRVLDIGAGYCGAARYLARTHGCRVTALNLSEVENQRARAENEAQGLGDLIEVIDGSFESLPFDDNSFDVVWSQDAILHSGQRSSVLSEVARVLSPGGCFVFTDPMQSDDCPEGVLQPILDRLHLADLASPGFYRRIASRHGLVEETLVPLTPHLVHHYARVLRETEKRERELATDISTEYLSRMKQGLRRWIEGGERGYLVWGMFRFRKDE